MPSRWLSDRAVDLIERPPALTHLHAYVIEGLAELHQVVTEGFACHHTIGTFHGVDITDSWECPGWFDAALCSGTEQVIGGQIVFVRGGGPALRVTNELILTDGIGDPAPLYIYWPEAGFVCPWYGTFAAALAANSGFAFDCDLAPLE